MADLTQQLADLNNNAKNLLSKYDGAFIRLNNESLKLMNEIDKKAKDAGDKIEKIVENTDLKSLGEEYKKLFDEKINELDNKEKEFSEKLTTALTDAKESVKAFDYMQTGKPTTKINPTKKNATWLDLTSGVIWVCVDNTKDKNKWVSEKGSVLPLSLSYGKADIFEDGSCIAYFPLKNNLNDLGGKHNLICQSNCSDYHFNTLGGKSCLDMRGGNSSLWFRADENFSFPSKKITVSQFLYIDSLYQNNSTSCQFIHSFETNAGRNAGQRIIMTEICSGKWYLDSASSDNTISNGLIRNRWLHFISQYDGSNVSIIVNGNKVVSVPARNFSGNIYFKLLDSMTGSVPYAFSNIRIFNKILTPSEIEILSKEQ